MGEEEEAKEGRVTAITNFGAFVRLADGREGLVHISEISSSFVRDIHDYLKLDQSVSVKVLGINKRGKLDLSIKQINPDFAPAHAEVRREGQDRRPPRRHINPESLYPKVRSQPHFQSLDDKLNFFLKKSDEKHLDLKKNRESKQRRGGSSNSSIRK